MTTEQFYTVERVEGQHAVLLTSDDHRIPVPLGELPEGIEERAVLKVPHRPGGPDWGAARVDAAETKRRRDAAQGRMSDLPGRDGEGGGGIRPS